MSGFSDLQHITEPLSLSWLPLKIRWSKEGVSFGGIEGILFFKVIIGPMYMFSQKKCAFKGLQVSLEGFSG